MGVKSKKKRRRNTSVSSRRQGNDDKAYADNWERIYGNKDKDSDGSDRDSSDGAAEDIRGESDDEDITKGLARLSFP